MTSRTHEVGLAARALASTLVVLVPSYVVERITNYYFLTSNPLFGDWSGLRIWLFIVLILAGSVVAGVLFSELLPAALCSVLGVSGLLLLVYAICDPKVCYSTGLDGLEPLRMGVDLSSVALVGASVGVYVRTRQPSSGFAYAATAFAAFVAIAYYPVVFSMAGTRLLGPIHPWAVVLLLFLLSFSTAAAASGGNGRMVSFALPVGAGAATILVSVGIASAYLSLIAGQILLMAVALVAGAAGGVLAMGRRRAWTFRHFSSSTKPLLLLVVFVLVMTVVILPDAVTGIVPQGAAAGSTPVFGMGVPVYAGAYMDSSLNRTEGESLTVSFAGTNTSAIQSDNYLAAGIGAHSPGCCVDGIDYGYRFDVYLFRSGNESLVASAWEVCDYVSACGGHSWKVLMFLDASDIGRPSLSSKIQLTLEWRDHTVCWVYAIGSGPARNLTRFETQPQENPYFNLGTFSGGIRNSMSGFFQFGMMSRYPIGRGGWLVTLECPAYMAASGWKCVDHARTLEGGQSYWKVLWRWGEDYPHVVALPNGGQGVAFSYSPSATMESFQSLW